MAVRRPTGTFAPAGVVAPAVGAAPLQFGVPGGPEVLVILLMLLLLLLPVALVVLVVGLLRLRGSGSTDDQVAALERRVAALESELEAERPREDGPSEGGDRRQDRP